MSATALPGDARPIAKSGIDWTPYLVGVGIGVLCWIVFAVANAPLGITTALSQVAGGAATPVLGADAVAQNAYWKSNPFQLDYGTLFLIGTFFGGMASALAAGSFRFETVPSVWRERFGGSASKRMLHAFVGGLVAMYGARLANGCTSGNGISGGLQLAVSGWTFLVAMFATGLVTAAVLYRKA